jgi:hypothetical protein
LDAGIAASRRKVEKFKISPVTPVPSVVLFDQYPVQN